MWGNVIITMMDERIDCIQQHEDYKQEGQPDSNSIDQHL